MKTVYIVFSRTSTVMGRLIRLATGGVYNHVALALSPTLDKLYSVSRLRYATPLCGGFTVESPARYTVGSNDNDARVKICALSVSDTRFDAICCRMRHSGGIIYNSFGALSSCFGRDISPRGAYTCVEFVSEAVGVGRISSVARFERLLRHCVVYEGRLSIWLGRHGSGLYGAESEREFFAVLSRAEVVRSTAKHFLKLISRMREY